MKQTITLILLLFSAGVFAQPCNGGRYSTNIFSTVDVTSDVMYGQNVSANGNTTDLLLDVYEPNGDTETARPLIIWTHGGSFIGGSKTDGDVVAWSNDFAEKGFVCASINYRLGMLPPDSLNAIKALLRAVQDLKAAVRFFYKDRQTTDTYKIDTTKIFIGGSSAGALTALHYAYLDKMCEVEYYMDATTLASMGGMEGDSGNPGYSTDIIGVMNGSGALASYGFIEAGDVPLCSVHGDQDATVPYNRDFASVSVFDIIVVDGSRMLHEQANAVGVQSNFYSFYGAGHVPYAGDANYMDTTINFFRDFVIDVMGCTDTPLQPANAPLETATLYQLGFCGLGIDENVQHEAISIYPNPSTGLFTVKSNYSGIIEVLDLTGKIIYKNNINGQLNIDLNDRNSGLYILKMTDEFNRTSTHKVIIE